MNSSSSSGKKVFFKRILQSAVWQVGLSSWNQILFTVSSFRAKSAVRVFVTDLLRGCRRRNMFPYFVLNKTHEVAGEQYFFSKESFPQTGFAINKLLSSLYGNLYCLVGIKFYLLSRVFVRNLLRGCRRRNIFPYFVLNITNEVVGE